MIFIVLKEADFIPAGVTCITIKRKIRRIACKIIIAVVLLQITDIRRMLQISRIILDVLYPNAGIFKKQSVDIEINGMFGAIQEKVPIDEEATKSFIEYFDKI